MSASKPSFHSTFPAPDVKDIEGTTTLQISIGQNEDVEEYDEEEEEEPAADVTVSCTCLGSDGREKGLGNLSGWIIRREDMTPESMDEISADAENLFATLFDSEGSFKGASEHDTGLFGEELEEGDILLIEQNDVSEEYRRKGVGMSMVKLALKKAEDLGAAWAFAWPVATGLEPGEKEPNSDRGPDLGERRRYRTVSEDFFRTAGFRKVGRTPWFCYAMDPAHPSRKSSAKDDSYEDFYQRMKGR